MSQTLAQTTRTAPDYGVHTSPEPATTLISRASVPEGFRAWLPALAILIGMPLLALATTKYVLLPSFKQAFTTSPVSSVQFAASQGAANLFFAKIPLNPTGIKRITLIGADNTFKNKIDQNQARLASLAASDLNGVKPADLYKPSVLDPMRAKLLIDFNHELGGPVVKNLYIGIWSEK